MCRFTVHGAAGENGQIQAVFDAFGIRYTGSSYAGCLLAMDKDISKKIMVQAGIKTAGWKMLHLGEGSYQVDAFPCVVKPCSCGSSIGVTIVENQTELEAALEAAFLYESRVLVEAKIEGREFFVGILDAKGDIWCLAANTLPGMTPVSLLPQEAKAAGISYHELCEAIVNHIS